MLSKYLLKYCLICLLIFSTCLAVFKKKKYFIYDAEFQFSINTLLPTNLVLNLHFRKEIKSNESVYNYFFAYNK